MENLIFNIRVTIESMEDSMDKQLVDQIVVRENQLNAKDSKMFWNLS